MKWYEDIDWGSTARDTFVVVLIGFLAALGWNTSSALFHLVFGG